MKKGMRSILAAVIVVGGLGMPASSSLAAAPVMNRTYVWLGQLVAVDVTGKTVTVKAQTPAHVATYINQFKPADKIVLVWDMIGGKTQADTVLYLSQYDVMKKSQVDSGYILPAEFVSADTVAKTVTFKAIVPDNALQALTSAQPGKWIKVTAPMNQPSEVAAITTIEVVDRPQATTASK